MGLSQKQFHIVLNALYLQPEISKIINHEVIDALDANNLIRSNGELTEKGKQVLLGLNHVKMHHRKNPFHDRKLALDLAFILYLQKYPDMVDMVPEEVMRRLIEKKYFDSVEKKVTSTGAEFLKKALK